MLNIISSHPIILDIILLISILFYITYLHIKISRFTKGKTATSLEKIINECINKANEIENQNKEIKNHAISLEKRISNSLRNIQTLRFKAFESNSSNQSFSLALLNEKGNGVVISSLHNRDRISTFAKPVENYKSEYELTEEEKEVIKLSKYEHKNIF